MCSQTTHFVKYTQSKRFSFLDQYSFTCLPCLPACPSFAITCQPPCVVPFMNTIPASSTNHQWTSWPTWFHLACFVQRNLIPHPLCPLLTPPAPLALSYLHPGWWPHTVISHPYHIHMHSHKSQPLTTQPPNPHPITHRGTNNTALLNRLTSNDLPLTHVHKTTIAPAYMRHQTQHLYHKHTICLRAPTLYSIIMITNY